MMWNLIDNLQYANKRPFLVSGHDPAGDENENDWRYLTLPDNTLYSNAVLDAYIIVGSRPNECVKNYSDELKAVVKRCLGYNTVTDLRLMS
jgi:hypothetical protein